MSKMNHSRDASGIASYIKEIRSTPLLSAEEERDLAARIAMGDVAARDLLVRANLRLVVNIAKGYQNRGVSYEDLIAEGNLGLIRATEGYDGRSGVRFCTYASFWIKQSIRAVTIKHGRFIRVPFYAVSLLAKWRRATIALTEQLGREPLEAEIAAELGLKPKKLKVARQALQTAGLTVHSNSSGSDDENDANSVSFEGLIDTRERIPEERLAELEQNKDLRNRIARLDPREESVLRMRFGLNGEKPRTLQEVGQFLGLTRERIRQLERSALGALAACDD